MSLPSRRSLLRACCGVAAGTLAGCSSLLPARGPNERPPETVGSDWTPPAGTWASSGGGPRNRHAVDAPGPGDDPSIVRRFPGTQPTYDNPRTVVAATPDTAYVLEQGGKRDTAVVRALRTGDWSERWRHEFDDSAYVWVGGRAGGRLYASTAGRVTALRTDGRKLWQVDVYGRLADAVGDPHLPEDRDDLDFRAVPTPGTVYGLSSYGFHGLDPVDGTEVWRVAFPDEYRLVPPDASVGPGAVWAVVDETVFRLDGSGLAALRLPDVGFPGPPVPADGRVIVTAGAEMSDRPAYSVAAYEPDVLAPADSTPPESTPVWQFAGHPAVGTATAYVTESAVRGGRVIVGEVVSPEGTTDQRAAVYAVDAQSGERLWSHEVAVANPDELDFGAAPVLSAPVLADGTVFVGVAPRWTFELRPVPEDGAVLAIDADSGALRWRHTVGIVPRRLAVAGEYCYVADGEGQLLVVG